MAKFGKEVQWLIKEAVDAGLRAGRVQGTSMVRDAYKATEKRLYAIPILQKKIEDDKEKLEELLEHGPKRQSKDIVRFKRTGYRIDPEEMLGALIQDLEATIAADENEIETVYRAMESFADDPYYPVVTGRYIFRYDDIDIAAELDCSPTQVWKQRSRIVKDISVLLYGSSAL